MDAGTITQVHPDELQPGDRLPVLTDAAGQAARVLYVEPYSDSETQVAYHLAAVPGYGANPDWQGAYVRHLILDNDCFVGATR